MKIKAVTDHALSQFMERSRRWIQKLGTNKEHFDICRSKRVLGAVEISQRELVYRIWRKSENAPP